MVFPAAALSPITIGVATPIAEIIIRPKDLTIIPNVAFCVRQMRVTLPSQIWS